MQEHPIVRDGSRVGLLIMQDAGDFTPLENMLEVCHKAALAVAEREPFYAESPLPWSLTVRLGGEEEGRTMNREFRHKDYATNVLSFPTEEESEEGDEERYLGDVFICMPVVEKEAAEQGKSPTHHLMHMVVHGLLHLAGYDHEDERVAKVMESLETDILSGLGVPAPYEGQP